MHHMRKTLISLLLLLCGAIGAARFSDLAAPSDLLSSNEGQADMTFVLRQRQDLRTLYSNPSVISDRQKRLVCRVDAYLESKWRREVSIPTNSTLAAVLDAIGVVNWQGGRQIRVIKKNSILQSDFPAVHAERFRDFRNVAVEPADIVVICPYD